MDFKAGRRLPHRPTCPKAPPPPAPEASARWRSQQLLGVPALSPPSRVDLALAAASARATQRGSPQMAAPPPSLTTQEGVLWVPDLGQVPTRHGRSRRRQPWALVAEHPKAVVWGVWGRQLEGTLSELTV